MKCFANYRIHALLIASTFVLLACAETQLIVHSAKELSGMTKGPVPKTKGHYKVGKPYRIENTWYYPAENFNYSETGIASWYGPKFHRRKTANGETFDPGRKPTERERGEDESRRTKKC